MKHKLPILSAVAVGLAIGVASTPALRPMLQANTGASASDDGSSAAIETDRAQAVLRQATRTLAQLESANVKIRLNVDLFGQQLSGSGRYLQGDSTSRRFRLEMKMPLGESFSSVQQVCDGQTLWIRRKLGGPAAVSKVDLRRIRAGQGGPAVAPPNAEADLPPLTPAIGGFEGILSGLDRAFDFRWTAEATLGRIPMHVVYGQWKPSYLARMLPDQKAAIDAGSGVDLSKLPQHMPDHVVLYLGRVDLFPYRIEYRRTPKGDVAAAVSERRAAKTLVGMELYEPRFNSGVDPQEFIYTPGNEQVADETDAYPAGQGG